MASTVHEFSFEWTLTKLTSFRDFERTPSFSLVPHIDVSLCFKYHYQQIKFPSSYESDSSIFRLSLIKLRGSDISASVDFEVKVTVNYSDGSYFYKYAPMQCNAREMKEAIFKDVLSRLYENHDSETVHFKNIINSNSLILKCCFTIKDNLSNKSTIASLPLNFIKNFSTIYEPVVLSDVKFIIDDKCLRSHKAILAAHSPVFLKMLTNDFKESQTNTITITDCDYDEFKAFLKYLYTADIDDPSWPNIGQLYRLADKYDVSVLKSDSQQRILLLMNEDTICDILQLVYEYEDKDFKEKVVHYAVTHIKSIIPTEAWKSMVSSHMHICFDVIMKFVPE